MVTRFHAYLELANFFFSGEDTPVVRVGIEANQNGRFVDYTDYEKLSKENAKLKEEIQTVNKFMKILAKCQASEQTDKLKEQQPLCLNKKDLPKFCAYKNNEECYPTASNVCIDNCPELCKR